MTLGAKSISSGIFDTNSIEIAIFDQDLSRFSRSGWVCSAYRCVSIRAQSRLQGRHWVGIYLSIGAEERAFFVKNLVEEALPLALPPANPPPRPPGWISPPGDSDGPGDSTRTARRRLPHNYPLNLPPGSRSPSPGSIPSRVIFYHDPGQGEHLFDWPRKNPANMRFGKHIHKL